MEPTEQELRKLYCEDLLSTVEIGKRFDMSYQSVNTRLKRYRIPLRKPGVSASSRGARLPTEDELRKLYLDDRLTTRQVGSKFGISKTEVIRQLKKHGIERRAQRNGLENRGIQPPTKAELEHMVWTEHLPYEQIAQKFGVDLTAVPQWLRKHGIQRPKIWDTRYKGIHPEPFNPLDVAARYDAGESTVSISQDYGIAATTLANKMREAGIPLRRDGFNGGHRYACRDGHEARSVYEKRVDDWLYSHGIEHELEPRYPWDKRYRADFKVGDTFIEVWGVTNNAAYKRRKQLKIEKCAEWGLPLIQISYWQFAKGRRFWTSLLPLVSEDSPADFLHSLDE